MWQEGASLQALKGGSCPALRNELSKETHMLTNDKARDYWEGAPRQRAVE